MVQAIIFGAGSIGCFNGISWLSQGLNVTFLGRAATGYELAENGGTISGPFGERSVASSKIHYFTEPKALADADIIFLTVKATGNEAAVEEIRDNARPEALIVSLQNGIGNAERLRALLPKFDIVEGMTSFNVVKTGPARWKKTINGELILARNPILEVFFQPLIKSQFKPHFHNDMRAVLWSKLLLNLNNALNALSGETLHAQLSNRKWRKILAAAQKEAIEVAKAEGVDLIKLTPLPPRLLPTFIQLPNWFFNTIGLRMQGVAKDARSSMSDDFAAGRKSEVDFLNGAVVEAAARHNISCPVNTAIIRMVKSAEAGVRKVWSAEDALKEMEKP